MVCMVARLRAVLFAVAFLTLTRIAYAQNIDITIQGNPWKASPSEERQRYLRGREADEMVRKGYICYREAGTTECSWAKPEIETRAHWEECTQSDYALKGRICHRVTPDGAGWYYDFERPLVPLREKLEEAFGKDPNAVKPATIRLMTVFLKKCRGIYNSKRLTDEQRMVLWEHFGREMDRTFREVDPEGYRAAQDKEAEEEANKRWAAFLRGAVEAEKATSEDSAAKPAPIPDATQRTRP